MAQVINTNIMSLNAQRNLNMTQSALATAMQRLSSGMRINSAKDDAAGLAISERFTTQIRGLNQAVRNANDGISLSQTAEGAMAEMTSNLQRIRELAVQSANATNSASDRAALDKEVQQRLQELQRIAEQTNFNGQKILDGTFGQALFQVGPNVGDTIGINLTKSMKTVDIGAFVSAPSDFTNTTDVSTVTSSAGAWVAASLLPTDSEEYVGVNDSAIAGGNVEINGVKVKSSADYSVKDDQYRSPDSAYAKALAINASGIPNVTATALNEIKLPSLDDGGSPPRTGLFLISNNNAVLDDTLSYTLSINGKTVINAATIDTTGITIDQAITAINSKQFETGVTASKDESGNIILTSSDGRNIVINESFTFADGGGGETDATVSSIFSTVNIDDDTTAGNGNGNVSQELTFRGQLTLNSSEDIVINQGQEIIGFSNSSYAAEGQLEGQNVLSVDASNNIIRAVDSALTTVSGLRSTFGAIQNRFESTIANLSTTAENLTASRSRIMDADFAAETAALSRAQILQQAGTAMVAQANQVPQGVLQLLQR